MSRILYIGILTLLMIQTATAQNDGCREFEKKMEMMADSLIRHLQPWKVSKDRIYLVENFGAKADGTTVNTASIQQAINVCSKDGGGYVVFSSGDYVTGTIELRQNVMLKVERGARLLGSTDLKDYPENQIFCPKAPNRNTKRNFQRLSKPKYLYAVLRFHALSQILPLHILRHQQEVYIVSYCFPLPNQ